MTSLIVVLGAGSSATPVTTPVTAAAPMPATLVVRRDVRAAATPAVVGDGLLRRCRGRRGDADTGNSVRLLLPARLVLDQRNRRFDFDRCLDRHERDED